MDTNILELEQLFTDNIYTNENEQEFYLNFYQKSNQLFLS